MEDNIFDKLRDLTGKFPEKLNILEEQIDIKVQMEYFKFSKKLKSNKNEPLHIDADNIPNIDLEIHSPAEIKEILITLAGIDDARAYRFIEEYVKVATVPLKDWAILALQESKMLLESSLLDENQIFISTGLGGKGNMLRYFVVIIGEGIDEFEAFQRKMVASEFEFALKKNNCELEKIEFQEKFATLMALIPFDVPFQKVIRQTLEECNQYGNFIKPNFLVTNVKPLTLKEIKEFVTKNELPDKGEYNELELDTTKDDDE
jgi:hypothetical protein